MLGILKLMLMCPVSSIFQAKADEGRLSYVYPCVILINQSF